MKLVFSVIAGLIAAFAIVMATDALVHATSPSTSFAGDPDDPAKMRAIMFFLPLGVLFGLVGGWVLAAFAGSAIATRLSGHNERAGLIVTALFLLATGLNFLVIAHPVWMMGAAVFGILLAGWLGSRLGIRAIGTGRKAA